MAGNTPEQIINHEIAKTLATMKNTWKVSAEQTDVLEDASKQPDIVISDVHENFSFFVETEYIPARSLVADAMSRLGKRQKNGQPINMMIMIKIPIRYKTMNIELLANDLAKSEDFLYAVLFLNARTNFPTECHTDSNDWLKGSLRDVADLAQTINYTIDDIEIYVKQFKNAISQAAKNVTGSLPSKISESLHQSEGRQTTHMGMSIILNAFLFQEILSGLDLKFHKKTVYTVPTLSQLRSKNRDILKTHTIEAWKIILDINYYPIFLVALEIIDRMPAAQCTTILTLLGNSAEELSQQMKYLPRQDIMSTVFQEMIADAKFLAAFYTKPETATMIASIVCPDSIHDPPDLTVGDFACGTGILLHAIYRRIEQIYESTTGLPMSSCHKSMMENHLIGCDVLPSSVHLTTSSLAGLHLDRVFEPTKLYIMKYGLTEAFDKNLDRYKKACDKINDLKSKIQNFQKQLHALKSDSSARLSTVPRQKSKIDSLKSKINHYKKDLSDEKIKARDMKPEQNVRCGSLELLEDQHLLTAWTTTDLSYRATSGATKDVAIPSIDLKHESCDMVVMNPPYSRDTNPEQKSTSIHHPVFAAFETPSHIQKILARRAKSLSKQYPEIDGRAGLGTHFTVIADKMLKPSGVLAMVLPLVFVQGKSWEKLRLKLLNDYHKILIITVSNSKKIEDAAFSANTGMRDMVLIAIKNHAVKTSSDEPKSIMSVVLKDVPQRSFWALEIGKAIADIWKNNSAIGLESEANAGTPIILGNHEIGSAMTMDIHTKQQALSDKDQVLDEALTANETGQPLLDDSPGLFQFKINCISDLSLAKVCYRLEHGELRLPHCTPRKIPITAMSQIGENGLLSRDIVSDDLRTLSADLIREALNAKIVSSEKFQCPRGPFYLINNSNASNTSYPAISKHDAKNQNMLNMHADGYYVPKPPPYAKNKAFTRAQTQKIWDYMIATAWRKSSRTIIATHFRFNSQPCVVGLSDYPVLGGSAFPNFILKRKKFEKAFSVWFNSSFGILLFWWNSGRQQPGRGIISKEARLPLPVLDFYKLTQSQIKTLNQIYDEFKSKRLLPLHELMSDTNRHQLDLKIWKCLFGSPPTTKELAAIKKIYDALSSESSIVGNLS